MPLFDAVAMMSTTRMNSGSAMMAAVTRMCCRSIMTRPSDMTRVFDAVAMTSKRTNRGNATVATATRMYRRSIVTHPEHMI